MLILTLIPTVSWAGELQSLIETALKSSPQIEQAKRQLKASEYEVKKAFGNYLPEVKFSYSYTDISDTPSYTMEVPGAPLPPTSFSLFKRKFYQEELSLQTPLFTGGRILNLVRVKKSQKEGYRFYLEEVKNLIVERVKEDYYEVLKAKALVETAKESLKSAKEHYRVVKVFFDENIVPRRDLLEAEVKVSEAEERLKEAIGYYRVALEKLRVDSGDFNFEPKGKINLEVEGRRFNPEELVERALKERAAIKQVKLFLRAAERGVDLAKSQFMPQAFLKLSYSKTDQYPLNGNFSNKSASVGISVPIFEGSKRFWELKRSREEKLKVKGKLEEVKRQVRLQVVSACTNIDTALKRIEAARKRVEEAKELLRDSKERYREHVGTSTEVIDAIAYLTSAKSSLVKAVADYYKALAQLEYAVGGKL